VKDALIAAALLAGSPARFGALWLRRADEATTQAILDLLAARLPCRKLPLTIDADRLSGGLDLTATLAAGRPIRQPGLLEEMRGGLLIIHGAERLPPATAARLAAAMDAGGPAILLLDEGIEDEAPPACLTERAAFHLSEPEPHLTPNPALPAPNSALPELVGACPERPPEAGGRRGPSFSSGRAGGAEEEQCFDKLSKGGLGVVEGQEIAPAETSALHSLAATASALGISSARADLFALRAARAHAALHGREVIAEDDLTFAARNILAPRATQVPAPPETPPPPDEQQDSPTPTPDRLEDIVLEAARAALPAQLLASLAADAGRSRARPGRGHGARRASKLHGRPLGARAGLPRGGARLALIDTLRAAAPWQRLRGRTGPLRLSRDDLRVRRFEARAPTLTILAVDASGSAAAQRLAEAKGAAELLLQQSYARRAEVALVAFRGTGAELLLPPTRSLTRARRLLAELPGGGGTPLAAGIEAARQLAESAAARGRTPTLVLLTDGRANIAADGTQSRPAAISDADTAARRVAAAALRAILIDISARPQPEAARLAATMSARYLHLPRANAGVVTAALA